MHFTHTLPSVQKAAQYIALLLALVIVSCQTKKEDSPTPTALGQAPKYTNLFLGNFYASGPIRPSSEMRYDLSVKGASLYSRGSVYEGGFEDFKVNWFSLDTLEGKVDITFKHNQLRNDWTISENVFKRLPEPYSVDYWYALVGCGLDKYYQYNDIVKIPYVHEYQGENIKSFIYLNVDPIKDFVKVYFNGVNIGQATYGRYISRYDYIKKPNDRLVVVDAQNATDTLYNMPIDSVLRSNSGLIVQGASISYFHRDTSIFRYLRAFSRSE